MAVCFTCLLVLLFKKERIYHEKFCGLVHVFCIVHILYCTNTLQLPLIILAIASEEGFVCWLVLPVRERNNFIQLSKNISLYCVYRFLTHEIIFFSQFQPRYSYKIYSYKKERVQYSLGPSSPVIKIAFEINDILFMILTSGKKTMRHSPTNSCVVF